MWITACEPVFVQENGVGTMVLPRERFRFGLLARMYVRSKGRFEQEKRLSPKKGVTTRMCVVDPLLV